MKLYIGFLAILLPLKGICQAVAGVGQSVTETAVTLNTATGNIAGTLSVPAATRKTNIPVALIIAGSGPTDRNGNNPVMKNNSLRMLSDSLLQHGIATLRYDKRAIGESAAAARSEDQLRFDDYVSDARGWLHELKQGKRFSKVVVIGHSEGSLIGMLIAQEADQYVSLAGAGQSADLVLKEQLKAQPPMIKDIAYPILDSLAQGKTVDSVNKLLYSLFRPSIQPYMISWFKYNPQTIIGKLTVPVLIVQGENDIQVSVEEAKLLSAANKKATLVLVPRMNHVLKPVEGDRAANIKVYNDPALPLAPELVKSIVGFIAGKK
ncbi:alpha/beta hydrolase [Paraflavitalea sp. CAU 1676]|uniref:alpha/beta hydrolase n=1 Tax=Paraflavitalea sp. CAU 1676 TaxID=3032598 RepID=UPI0023DA4DF5|nr:alpha/beta hydrolase [Paraflavitalea sp. CAU 1676]MDF2191792.1 alpha/beta hydrolase [Paraflavitalea sp. CAU 1676]